MDGSGRSDCRAGRHFALQKRREARVGLRVRALMTFVSVSQRTELYPILLSISFESLFWPHELSDFVFKAC